jgi:hypothetical protein
MNASCLKRKSEGMLAPRSVFSSLGKRGYYSINRVRIVQWCCLYPMFAQINKSKVWDHIHAPNPGVTLIVSNL